MLAYFALAENELIGRERYNFMQCDNGWYGVDCSIPSVHSSIEDWPQWLRPAQVSIHGNGPVTGNTIGLEVVVEKKRPLIYIYDLPPKFNSLLLEGRHFKFECVNRIYDPDNATVWTDQLYGSQIAMYESMLARPHRTLNGEEADYYFVPVLDSCIITRADDAPHLSMEGPEIRTGFLKGEKPIQLKEGREITISTDYTIKGNEEITISTDYTIN